MTLPFSSFVSRLRRARGARLVPILTGALLLLLSPTGCMPPPSMPRYAIPPIGANCKIQFRRNALGAGGEAPIPPTTDVFNGSATSLSGRLKQFTAEWIVLDVSGKEVWIPKTVVLLIEVQNPSAGK